MPDEIRECPFCGCGHTFVFVSGPWARVQCPTCGAHSTEFNTAAAAIGAWNQRHITDPVAIARRMVLSDCTRLLRERIALHNTDLLVSVAAIAESLRDGYE